VAAVYEDVMASISARDKQKSGLQISLFESILEDAPIEVTFPNIPEYDMMEKLSKEKSVLGVYVSGHPFEKFLPYFKDRTFTCAKLAEYTEDEETGDRTYTEIEHNQPVTMGGMIAGFKKFQLASGFMAFVTVEDLWGTVECVCFPKVYERIKGFLEADKVVSLTGKISINDGKAPSIVVDKMWEFTLEETEDKSVPRVNVDRGTFTPAAPQKTDAEKRLWLNISTLEDEDVDELLETLSYYPGETVVCFVKDGKKMMCSQKVNPNKALMAELCTFLSENCIKLL
jgi:DNA polymerase-3 subunit alpha